MAKVFTCSSSISSNKASYCLTKFSLLLATSTLTSCCRRRLRVMSSSSVSRILPVSSLFCLTDISVSLHSWMHFARFIFSGANFTSRQCNFHWSPLQSPAEDTIDYGPLFSHVSLDLCHPWLSVRLQTFYKIQFSRSRLVTLSITKLNFVNQINEVISFHNLLFYVCAF